ncbi:MAG: RNA polymerase sigma factor [Candidatus Moranbacteria bacterium]|nr:RNA polymerase sigma factor [Candidatus Moranbacteria bacterium]
MDLVCGRKKECRKKSDEEIVDLIKGNKQCYVCLMERYEEKIIRYIKRISGVSEETAEDIAQNIFLKVYINLNDFDSKLKFSSWLYRIAHNETINYWRRNNKRAKLNVSWDDNEALQNIIKDEKNIEQEVYQKITNEKLIKAINQLDEKYREVILLNYLEGKSYQEIADILKKPMGTVGTLINRAKFKLVEELKNLGISKQVANK